MSNSGDRAVKLLFDLREMEHEQPDTLDWFVRQWTDAQMREIANDPDDNVQELYQYLSKARAERGLEAEA